MSTLDRDDLYVDNYYDYNAQDLRRDYPENAVEEAEGGPYATLFRVMLAILLRVGFLLVQIGSVPVGNVNLILLQNVVDFCVVTIVYILVGFIAAFNEDVMGLVGDGRWIGDSTSDKDEAMAGWCAVVTASAICTCGVVGRMHTVGYVAVAILLSGVVQPFLMHWAWTPKGWMHANFLSSKRVSFRDYAGAGPVHVIGSLSGLIGCLTLGRRILRLRDIDDASLSPDSPGSSFAGYLLIFLGLLGLSMPSTAYAATRASAKHISHVIVNNLLAASACALFVVALHFALSREAFNYWTVMRCVQAAVSGVVTVAAGADIYSPLVAVGVSCAGGAVFYLVSRKVYRSALEDYCNIVATHLACGLLGSFIAPLCGAPPGEDPDNHTMALDVAWQVICILTFLFVITVTMAPLFIILEVLGFLRNRSEYVNNLRAVVALRRGPPRSYMQRLFFPDEGTLYLQPGNPAKTAGKHEVSGRFLTYQQEISQLEGTRPKELGEMRSGKAYEGGSSTVRDNVVHKETGRVKKVRQIYTIRTASTERVGEYGGNGESLDNVRSQGDPGKISLNEGGMGNKFKSKLMSLAAKDPTKETSFLESCRVRLNSTENFESIDIEDCHLRRFNPTQDIESIYIQGHHTETLLSANSGDRFLRGFNNPPDVSLSTDVEDLKRCNNLIDVSSFTNPEYNYFKELNNSTLVLKGTDLKDRCVKGFNNPTDISLSTNLGDHVPKRFNPTYISLDSADEDLCLKEFNDPTAVPMGMDLEDHCDEGFNNPIDISLSTDLKNCSVKVFNNPALVSLGTNSEDSALKRFSESTVVSIATDLKDCCVEGFYDPIDVSLSRNCEDHELKRFNPTDVSLSTNLQRHELERFNSTDESLSINLEDRCVKEFSNPTDDSVGKILNDRCVKGFNNPTDVSLSTNHEGHELKIINSTDDSLSTDFEDHELKRFNPTYLLLSTDLQDHCLKEFNHTDVSLSTNLEDRFLNEFNSIDILLSTYSEDRYLKGFNPTFDDGNSVSKQSLKVDESHTQPHYKLHRTPKFTNLHSQESKMEMVHHEVQ